MEENYDGTPHHPTPFKPKLRTFIYIDVHSFLQSDTSRYMSQHLRVHVHSTTRTPTVPFQFLITQEYLKHIYHIGLMFIKHFSRVFPGYFGFLSVARVRNHTIVFKSSEGEVKPEAVRTDRIVIACGPYFWYHLVMTNIANVCI